MQQGLKTLCVALAAGRALLEPRVRVSLVLRRLRRATCLQLVSLNLNLCVKSLRRWFDRFLSTV